MNCSKCETDLPGNAQFCFACGNKVNQAHTCISCNVESPPEARFCLGCGQTISAVDSASAPNNILGYCKGSGSSIYPGDKHFKCAECSELYLESYRFLDKAFCKSCTHETGVETALLSEQANRQAEAARLATEQQAADNKARQQAAELARAQAAKDKAQILKDTDFVDIPAGDFMMGSPESEPERGDNERLHWIEVEAFKMLSTPVTFAQYDQYCEMSGAEKPDDEGWGRQKRPMINVSYWDAVDFCTWVTEQTGIKHRLPTEAEWEYACRAGTTTPFWTGQNGTTDQANYRGDYPYNDNPEGIYREKTTLVDHFPVNPWGLHDMHGNVWEWCASVYDEAYQGAETQGPSGDSNDNSPRLLRGGSWLNIGGWLRSASRNCNEPAWRYCNIGFRVVQDTRG